MAYAAGKLAWGACDRCGQRFLLNDLKKEWQNLKVCVFCYDPKQPQLEPRRNVSDAIALYEPRPLPDDAYNVFIGQVGASAFGANGMMPDQVAAPTAATSYTGNIRAVSS